jgi:hypothetical protein
MLTGHSHTELHSFEDYRTKLNNLERLKKI